MQVSRSHVVPAYVVSAFQMLQRDHMFDDGNGHALDIEELLEDEISSQRHEQGDRSLRHWEQPKVWSSDSYMDEDGSWKRLQASPEQHRRQQVALLNQPMPPTQSERRQMIDAQVQADLERIYGPDFNNELEKEMNTSETVSCEAAPVELVDGLSEPRIIESVPERQPEYKVLLEGVWEPLKPMATVHTHHIAPEGFQIGEVREVDQPEESRRKVLPYSLVQWLAMLNDMSAEQARADAASPKGVELLDTLKSYLFHVNGVQAAVADELEYLGYQVSYDRINGTLLLEMASGAIRWDAI